MHDVVVIRNADYSKIYIFFCFNTLLQMIERVETSTAIRSSFAFKLDIFRLRVDG